MKLKNASFDRDVDGFVTLLEFQNRRNTQIKFDAIDKKIYNDAEATIIQMMSQETVFSVPYLDHSDEEHRVLTTGVNTVTASRLVELSGTSRHPRQKDDVMYFILFQLLKSLVAMGQARIVHMNISPMRIRFPGKCQGHFRASSPLDQWVKHGCYFYLDGYGLACDAADDQCTSGTEWVQNIEWADWKVLASDSQQESYDSDMAAMAMVAIYIFTGQNQLRALLNGYPSWQHLQEDVSPSAHKTQLRIGKRVAQQWQTFVPKELVSQPLRQMLENMLTGGPRRHACDLLAYLQTEKPTVYDQLTKVEKDVRKQRPRPLGELASRRAQPPGDEPQPRSDVYKTVKLTPEQAAEHLRQLGMTLGQASIAFKAKGAEPAAVPRAPAKVGGKPA